MATRDPIKVCLTNGGADTETPWAEDLGPAPGPRGSRRVRLINVPFMHAKPTWGDTIIVSPVDDGLPTWDRGGVPWPQISSRIAEDGGRWAMIVDYAPHPDANDAFAALAQACAEHDVVCEGAWGPHAGRPGRAYLAVNNELGDAELMRRLREAALPCELVQIHPAPAKQSSAKRSSAKRTSAKRTSVKRTSVKRTSVKRTSVKRTSVKRTSVKRTSVKRTSAKPMKRAPAKKRSRCPRA